MWHLKEGFGEKVLHGQLGKVGREISKNDFILMDGSDISKKHAKYIEGLEFFMNGDTGEIGLGYNVLNINAINARKEITPLYSKAYSYEMGALSSNNAVKKAVRGHLGDNGCWVFDRGADNGILKDFFFGECPGAIVRLKKNTELFYGSQECQVVKLARNANLCPAQIVVRIKKDRPVTELYELGALPVEYKIVGKVHHLCLVISRNKRHWGCISY